MAKKKGKKGKKGKKKGGVSCPININDAMLRPMMPRGWYSLIQFSILQSNPHCDLSPLQLYPIARSAVSANAIAIAVPRYSHALYSRRVRIRVPRPMTSSKPVSMAAA